jgi:hypothetical protein
MNLAQIENHLKKRKYKNENHFFKVLYSFCHRYKIDYATFSTVGCDYLGNNIVAFDKEGFFDSTNFDIKKVTKEQSDEKLTSLIKTKYINKKDVIVIYRSFWGLQKIVFYDSTTNQNFCLGGNEKENFMEFKKLVDSYHEL